MKKNKRIAAIGIVFLFWLSGPVNGQPYVLNFDGIDDYVNLGANAGNGIRTIEMWFMPNTDIDINLPEFSTLVCRECCGTNIEEFSLTFMQYNSAQPGKLRFYYSYNTNNYFTVASDADSWNMNQWYHVAVVIHPQNGMSLYIDGVKQVETNTFNSATTATTDITAIGRWGITNIRHFDGRVEDVRFSSNAVYTANFTPPCPDIPVMPNSQGVWHFNEGTGTVATDASGNGYDGTIYGATYVIDTICANPPCPPPIAGFTADTSTGTTVQFTDTSSSATSWVWDFGDLQQSTTQNPMHIYASAGWYYVCLTVTDTCGTDNICDSIYVAESIGVNESMAEQHMVVFPNPTTGKFQIQSPNPDTYRDQVEKVEVFDLFGRKVLESESKEPEIDMSGYAKGMYILKLVGNKRTYIKKLILE